MLENLEPERLWRHFENISKIPRCSGNESGIREYVVNFARSKGLVYRVDGAGNVVIKKGEVSNTGPVLQAHLDMVCEKNSDVQHDFSKDPLDIYIDGEWVKARGTTLGADNGIGVAAALSLLEEDLSPFEVLLTVDEETGLTGAYNLEPELVDGRFLLNLDTEEEGVFIIGCAGGGDSIIRLKTEVEEKKGTGLRLKLSGLKGGHSGMDINTGRGNAIKLMARLLLSVIGEIELNSFEGGDKRNAIPRECTASFFYRDENVKERILSLWEDIREEYRSVETDMSLEMEEVPLNGVLTEGRDLVKLLILLPHGVISMSRDIEGLVQTSTNLASVHLKEGYVEIVESSRSSMESELSHVREVIRLTSEMFHAEVEQPAGYPAWKPQKDSMLVKKASQVYERLFQRKPIITAIHAGLETGVLGKKIPGLDMISFGPTIKNPHSPDERVHIPSVLKFYNFLKELVKELI